VKVVHITFSSAGGAGSVASDLQKFQINAGMNSELYCLTSGDIKTVILRRPYLFLTSLIDYYIVKRPEAGLFTLFRRGINFGRKNLWKNSLILHIHWYPGAISLSEVLSLCNKSVPMLITLHDMLPITGGCHFSHGCEKHLGKCEGCPQVRKPFQWFVSQRYLKKSKIYRKNPSLGFTTPGPWLLEQLKNSPISAGSRSRLIFNPVSTDIFTPRNSKAIRASLQIPLNAFVIGSCAVNVQDPRKRIDLIFKAWESIQKNTDIKREIWLMIVGGGTLRCEIVKAEKYIRLPLIDTKTELANIFSIFDVFCSMSSAETFPNVLHECAAIGVPAILSEIPGHSHAIGDFALGVGKEDNLSEAIMLLERNHELRIEMRRNALKFAKSLNQLAIHELYLKEYQHLIEVSGLEKTQQ
jgi:glycosyltransferase involved in cell wall biosynthesis